MGALGMPLYVPALCSVITWYCWHACLHAYHVPVSPLGGLDMLVCVLAVSQLHQSTVWAGLFE